MKQKLFFLLLLFGNQFLLAQESFELKGKIVSQSSDLESITIFNQTQKKGTYSDASGYFFIQTSIADTLFFSAIHLKPYIHVITLNDSVKKVLFVPMESNVKELNELSLTEYKNITAEALGIVRPGIVVKTQAERKLLAAKDGILNTLLNAISGRTKQFKKEVAVEKKEMLMEDLRFDFDAKYVIKKLQIPKDYVKGFYFYLVEQTEFVEAYKSKNQIKTEFVISKMAVQYKNIITPTKEVK